MDRRVRAGQAASRAGWGPGVARVGRDGDLNQVGVVLAREKRGVVQGGVVGQGPRQAGFPMKTPRRHFR